MLSWLIRSQKEMHLASIRSSGICFLFFLPLQCCCTCTFKMFKQKSYQGQQYTSPTDFISAVSESLKHTLILVVEGILLKHNAIHLTSTNENPVGYYSLCSWNNLLPHYTIGQKCWHAVWVLLHIFTDGFAGKNIFLFWIT